MRRALLLCATLIPAVAWADPTGTLQGSVEGLGKGPFVVYIEQIPEAKYPPQQPAPVMAQRGNTFVPHILPVVVGSRVELRSSDPELHDISAWAQSLGRTIWSIAIPPNSPPAVRPLDRAGMIRLTCAVHKDMLAFILVLQNPFFAQTGRLQTDFTISDIPAGMRNVRIWAEKLEPEQLARRYPVEILPGQVTRVTLGPIRIAARRQP